MYYSYEVPFSVGVNTARFNNVYARQSNSMWCWAACLEMVLKHNGVNISQSEFAKHTCGVNRYGIPNNCPASFDIITEYLNMPWGDSTDQYSLTAPLNYGTPELIDMYDELNSGSPVIVAIRNRNSTIGHAVLITGIEGFFYGNLIYVTKFIIRDPWPSIEGYFSQGRVEIVNATAFMDSMSAYWFPALQREYAKQSIWG